MTHFLTFAFVVSAIVGYYTAWYRYFRKNQKRFDLFNGEVYFAGLGACTATIIAATLLYGLWEVTK